MISDGYRCFEAATYIQFSLADSVFEQIAAREVGCERCGKRAACAVAFFDRDAGTGVKMLFAFVKQDVDYVFSIAG